MRVKYIGLGLVQGWLWVFFLNGPLLYIVSDQKGSAETIFIFFLLFNSLSFLLTARTVAYLAPLLSRRALLGFGAFLMSAGPLLVAACPPACFKTLAIIATAASGFGGALLITAWGELFSSLPVKTAGLAFSGAVFLGTLLFFLCGALSPTLALAAVAGYPWLSLLLLLLAARSKEAAVKTFSGESNGLHLKRIFPFPPRLVAMLFLYYVAGGFMFKIVCLGWRFSSQEVYYLTNLIYCAVVVLAGVSIFLVRDFDLRYLYRPVLPLIGAGFLLFPVLYETLQYLPCTLFQAGFALFDTYTWLLFVYLAARHRYPAAVVGYGFFLITISILAGECLSSLIIPSLSVSPQGLHLISILAALTMLLAAMAFQGQKETFAGWEAPFLVTNIRSTAESQVAVTKEDAGPISTGTPDAAAPRTVFSIAEEHYPSTTMPGTAVFNKTDYGSEEDDIVLNGEKQPDCSTLADSFALSELGDRMSQSYSLTKRETEVLLMLLQGRNNPYMREQLNISVNTLKTHLRNLYNKLSVKNRQELLSLFVRYEGRGADTSQISRIH